MNVELSILKYLLQKEHYNKYSSYLSPKDFPDELKVVYTSLCSIHSDDDANPSVMDLANVVFSLSPKDKEYYEKVFETLETYTPIESTVVKLIDSLKRRNILQRVSIAAYEECEGKQPEGYTQEIFAALQHVEQVAEETFVSDDLDIILNETIKQPGLRWRLQCLNTSLGSLRKGDFGFIFARPEAGKTTFLASEVSGFLPQCDGPILWFNNEEQGSKVMLRVYQAYFGVTLETLYGNIKHYRDLFQQQTGGRFKLYDSAQINKNTVEALSKKLLPSLIIFDQIDKITGFKADREDLLLGAIYQWARELAKRYAPVIGVTQADGSGEGVRWLTMANVANAKTAKQAEADWILGIGTTHDSGWEAIRFLNISKNKLMGDTDSDPKQRHGKLQCLIEPEHARYKDLVS
jgi:hypothetical protein